MKNSPTPLVAGLLVTLFLASISPNLKGAVDAEGYVEVEDGAVELLTILESLPYAAEGEGPVVYTFEFSECGYCQAKYRDFDGQDLGLEFRRFFVPVSDRSARETAALGKSRSSDDYHAFMQGRKAAPAFDQDNDAIDAYNSIITAASESIPPILKQNGWSARGLVFPAYFWFEDGKLYANGGYLKENFEGAMARARAGWTDASRELLASVTASEGSAAPETAASTAGHRESTGVDIVGLEIGMTKDEAIAAIKAHDPRMEIAERPVSIVTRDSNRHQLEIGSYVKGLEAWIRHGIPGFDLNSEPTEKIVIHFSPPPAEHRVEFVGREVTYPALNAPDFQATLQSIAGKYGEPTQETDSTNDGTARVGLVTQLWQQSGTNLEGRQFIRWSNKSGIMAPLNFRSGGYHSVGGQRPPVSDDRTGLSLGILVNKQGHIVHMMRFMLTADKQTIEQNHAATWDLGQAALQQHEQKLRGAAQQRSGPKL